MVVVVRDNGGGVRWWLCDGKENERERESVAVVVLAGDADGGRRWYRRRRVVEIGRASCRERVLRLV